MYRMLETINVKLSSYLRNFRVLAEKEKVIKGAKESGYTRNVER